MLLFVVLALVLAPAAYPWTCPLSGPVLRPFAFGDNPYAGGLHRGVDLGAEVGTAVGAPASGTVSFVGTVPAGGKAVTIATSDGYSVTLLQLGSTVVSRGAIVAEGDVVGSVGPSEDAVTSAPHVHVGLRVSAEEEGYVDPLSVLPACGQTVVVSPPVEALPVPLPAEPSPESEPAPAEGFGEPAPVETEPVGPAAVELPLVESAADEASAESPSSEQQSPAGVAPVVAIAPVAGEVDPPFAEPAATEPQSAGVETPVAEDAAVSEAIDSPVLVEAAASEPQSAGIETPIAEGAPEADLEATPEAPASHEAAGQRHASEGAFAEGAEVRAASGAAEEKQIVTATRVQVPVAEASAPAARPDVFVTAPAAASVPTGSRKAAEQEQPQVRAGAGSGATADDEVPRARRSYEPGSARRLVGTGAVAGPSPNRSERRNRSREATASGSARVDAGGEPGAFPLRAEPREKVASTQQDGSPYELPLELLVALLCVVLLATGGVAAWWRLGVPKRRQQARIMASGDADAREADDGSRCGGVAIREWAPAHRPRGRVRRPIRHLRPLPPPERQPRADGEWHGRARDAGHGRRRPRGRVSA